MSKILGDEKYIVCDDILTDEESKLVEQKILGYNFPWFSNYVNYKETSKTVSEEYESKFDWCENIHEGVQQWHYVYKDGGVTSNVAYPVVEDIIIKALNKFNVESLDIIRCKFNLQHQLTGNKKEFFNTPHIDITDKKHMVMIYYVNDNDGVTRLFDNEQLEILAEVKSKRGRFVFMDGNVLHAGQHPINSPFRCVLNLDFDPV
jgi:hypothetical protein